MIEIDTIQDIRKIDSKLIGGFSSRQIISFVVGAIIGAFLYFVTKNSFIAVVTALIIIALGVIKKGNLTALEYISFLIDKEKQVNVRTYKNKNLIAELEEQCKAYNPSKKKRRRMRKYE